MEKICTKCKKSKNIENFSKRKSSKDGHYTQCKECVKEMQSKYYKENKERCRENNKKWIIENKDKAEEIWKKYRKSEKRRKVSREWARKKENRIKQYKYWNDKYHKDPQFNIRIKLRRRIHSALKQRSLAKTETTIKLLGCSYCEFKEYIQNKFLEGMTWEKVLNSEIHLDHIIPCNFFDLTKEEEQLKCFNYTNLQPLWAKDNLSKHDSIPIKEVCALDNLQPLWKFDNLSKNKY